MNPMHVYRSCTLALCSVAIWLGGGCGGTKSETSTTGAPVSVAAAATPAVSKLNECRVEVPDGPTGCPQTHAAEAAWEAVVKTCKLEMKGDLKFDRSTEEVIVLPSAKTKIQENCDCQQTIGIYYGRYQNCTGADEGNTNLAKALFEATGAVVVTKSPPPAN